MFNKSEALQLVTIKMIVSSGALQLVTGDDSSDSDGFEVLLNCFTSFNTIINKTQIFLSFEYNSLN